MEQVTKEKFLRSITDNPPRLVEAIDNDAKEKDILALKAALKEHKEEISDILQQLEARGRDLSLRYQGVSLRTQDLTALPVEIQNLEASIDRLKEEQLTPSTNPELALPLPDTVNLLEQREADLAAIDAQLSKLQSTLPNRTRELEKLERELKPLEVQNNGTAAAAKEARRRKEDGGGVGNELEERGRWLKASEQLLNSTLET